MRKAVITVAPTFDEASLALLKNGICERFEDISVSVVTDGSLTGGFLVDFDGKMYDFSVEAQLNSLKRYIAEE